MSLSLRSLATALSTGTEQRKTYFPMSRLTAEYASTVFPFPQKQEFGIEKMGNAERAVFDKWYEAEWKANHGHFDFDKMLYE